MQTVTLNIQDNFMKDFLQIIEQYKDKIQLQKDKNLEYDSYFYERRRKLHQIRNDIKNGNMKLLSQEDSDKEVKQFFEELEK
jgi:hypothetical protein